MSIKVSSYTWEHSQHKGSALLLLLAIADHAHDDGGGAYPSVEALAAKIRMTERNTQLLLRKLEASGELVIDQGAGPNGCNVYRVMMGAMLSGVKSFQADPAITGGVKASSPKPSVNRHMEGGRERARAADASGTQPNTNGEQAADDPITEEPTRAADRPPAADADREAMYARWQEIWGTWANGTPPARLARVFDDWALVHGWSGIWATLRYADARYDLATNPNVINLLGAMLENARADNRPYGTHTTQYEQHKQERQHGPRGAARAPRSRGRRRDAAAGPDHSVQPPGQTNGQPDAAGAAVERPAPRFVQRLRAQAAQAEHGGR